jgi:glycine/D-amino acid oxidase-like deaminating enzyme
MDRTRRWFVKAGAAALAGVPVLPSLGFADEDDSPVRRLRPANRHLRTPHLPKEIELAQCLEGYRPHRIGGIRLEKIPVDQDGETRWLIHNYGHSGAGITLSWGCAGEVLTMVRAIAAGLPSAKRLNIGIAGCGVIGLTAARVLRDAYPNAPITLYCKDFKDGSVDLTRCTSWVAGGQIEPSVIWQEYGRPGKPGMQMLNHLMKASVLRIRSLERLRKWNAYGIEKRSNFSLLTMRRTGFEAVLPERNFWRAKYGILPFANLDSDTQRIQGIEYQTWLMNPRVLLPALVKELRTEHVGFTQMEFRSADQLRALPHTVIVNCTGGGAKALFEPDAMQLIKGQLVVVPNPQKIDYFFSGGCAGSAYLFGRQNDLVIGGTYERFDAAGQFHEVPPGPDLAKCQEFVDRMRIIFYGEALRCGISKDPPPPSS